MVFSWFSSHSENILACWKDSILLKVKHVKERDFDCSVARLVFFLFVF